MNFTPPALEIALDHQVSSISLYFYFSLLLPTYYYKMFLERCRMIFIISQANHVPLPKLMDQLQCVWILAHSCCLLVIQNQTACRNFLHFHNYFWTYCSGDLKVLGTLTSELGLSVLNLYMFLRMYWPNAQCLIPLLLCGHLANPRWLIAQLRLPDLLGRKLREVKQINRHHASSVTEGRVISGYTQSENRHLVRKT